MNARMEEISLAHIHAYVDAQLNDDDCAAVEAYLDEHPSRFEELQQYLAINEHYQAMFGELHNEASLVPLPVPLDGARNELFLSSPSRISDFINHLETFLFDNHLDLPLWLTNAHQGLRVVKNRVFTGLRLNRLEETGWYAVGRSRISRSLSVFQNRIVTGINGMLLRLKLHPRTAPAWLDGFVGSMSDIKTKILKSFAQVNLFVVISITLIGVFIGSRWQESSLAADKIRFAGEGVESLAVQSHLLPTPDEQKLYSPPGGGNQALLAWVSNRLGQPVRIIDLSDKGYKHAGLMLIPAAADYALVSIYRNDKMQKLSLYIGRREAEKNPNLICKSKVNAKDICTWNNNKLQFVVVSDSTASHTKQISKWIMNNYSVAGLSAAH